MAVSSGTVSVTSASAVKVCTMGESGALIFTDQIVFLGGPNVASSGANMGVKVPITTTPVAVPGARAVMSATVPAGPDLTADLYAIASGTTANVSFLAPQGG